MGQVRSRPPLDLDGMVHLIRVESIRKAQLDEVMRSLLLQELRNEWLEEQLLQLRARITAQQHLSEIN